MKYRYLLVGIIIFLLYAVLPKQLDEYAPKKPAQMKTVPALEKKVTHSFPEEIFLVENHIKPTDPPQQMSHEEFVAGEKKYATEKLKSLVIGWCNSSEAEVREHFINSYAGAPDRARAEVRRPGSLCLNKENTDWQCFTYQVHCPSHFQETNDVTLLEYWSGEIVYRYERRVMDYKTYIDNPDNPAFPGPSYWASRANDIKILAERVRGEPIEEQNWANFRDGLSE